ncbi:MAG TPA: 6-phosphogluconolactonase [Candidatus Binatus sp.]|nr:6-phosphogluconolactonase [Candidatus Binatus sp.]
MLSGRRVVVLDTADDVAYQAATEFEVRARAAIEQSGRFAVALSGGKTPNKLFRLLASPDFAEDIDWTHIHFFWSDERCVPPTDDASNYKQALDALLATLSIPRENVHRMHGELKPHEGAIAYSGELRAFFGETVRFDCVFLGLGEDGHTASLFPNNEALDAVEDPCVAVDVPDNAVAPWRLTLTYPVLNGARGVIFVADGAEKASVVARVLEGPHDARRLPAQGVAPQNGSLVWLIDRAAASELHSRV